MLEDMARRSFLVRYDPRCEQALKGVGEPVRVWSVKGQGTGNKEQR